jgi:hypothetical protein
MSEVNPSEPKPKNWWGRNWPWVIPIGCLTPIILAVGTVVLIFSTITGFVKSSNVYQRAFSTAKTDPEVIAALGSPIQENGIVSGNLNVDNASGEADLTIPISGPKGNGSIFVKASKSENKWTYSRMAVEVNNSGQEIDLLDN